MTHYAQVTDTLFMRGRKTGTDARRVNFNADEILVRVLFRHRDQRGAHPETDFQHNRCRATKQGINCQRFCLKLHAHHRPEIVQRELLTFGQTALTADKTTDTAHRATVLVELR
ncbi:hypothetical protein SRABI106_04804 [Rahnella aquatilis]|nr:hypothetical protein SRABI106_04804 [Rahnella aquatilis]